jgi:DinB superfamily
MATQTQTEVWLRGPMPGVDPALMPAAHALQQTIEDVEKAVTGLSHEQVWMSPGGASSLGFHLLHLSGSTDRLLTYARGATLNDAQKAAIGAEKTLTPVDLAILLADLRRTFDAALAQVRTTSPASLQDARAVGRAGLPTTVSAALQARRLLSVAHAGDDQFDECVGGEPVQRRAVRFRQPMRLRDVDQMPG